MQKLDNSNYVELKDVCSSLASRLPSPECAPTITECTVTVHCIPQGESPSSEGRPFHSFPTRRSNGFEVFPFANWLAEKYNL